jgi:hypothetical protein
VIAVDRYDWPLLAIVLALVAANILLIRILLVGVRLLMFGGKLAGAWMRRRHGAERIREVASVSAEPMIR